MHSLNLWKRSGEKERESYVEKIKYINFKTRKIISCDSNNSRVCSVQKYLTVCLNSPFYSTRMYFMEMTLGIDYQSMHESPGNMNSVHFVARHPACSGSAAEHQMLHSSLFSITPVGVEIQKEEGSLYHA